MGIRAQDYFVGNSCKHDQNNALLRIKSIVAPVNVVTVCDCLYYVISDPRAYFKLDIQIKYATQPFHLCP